VSVNFIGNEERRLLVEIVFAGICCWVDAKVPKVGKTVIIPNSTRGGTRRGRPIPPHSAFIHAKRQQVESTNWTPAFTAGEDNLAFLLGGDFVTFDPLPGGGAIDIADLPHVRAQVANEPICPAADELRPGYRDHPNAVNVLGLIDLPPEAAVSTSSHGKGAMVARLRMPDGPVTITATPFANDTGPRSLKITDPNASVFICNVSMMDYFLGIPAEDDDHKYLVCEMFKPHVMANPNSPNDSDVPMMVAELSEPEEEDRVDGSKLSKLQETTGKAMDDFLCTFAAGCSDSQWP
jgi:hypothetical protein